MNNAIFNSFSNISSPKSERESTITTMSNDGDSVGTVDGEN